MLNQTMKHHTAMMFPRVHKIVQECGAMCEHMVSHFLCMLTHVLESTKSNYSVIVPLFVKHSLVTLLAVVFLQSDR